MRAAACTMALLLLDVAGVRASRCAPPIPTLHLALECASQAQAAGPPSQLLAEATAWTVVALHGDCTRARPLSRAGRRIRRARVLVERAHRRGWLGDACADTLRAQVASAVAERRRARDLPR